jgi:hypothetical protein
MKLRVVVLGAGFGGLELSTRWSEALGEQLDLILLDKNDSFFRFFETRHDVEFGEARVGRVDVEFLAGPPTGSFMEPSVTLSAEKVHFGTSRRSRWFGLLQGFQDPISSKFFRS